MHDLNAHRLSLRRSLNSAREPIPDVAAVYFINPSSDSIKRLVEDMSRKLYDSYYINFATSVPRYMLEELASNVVSNGLSNQIAQVSVLWSDKPLLCHFCSSECNTRCMINI